MGQGQRARFRTPDARLVVRLFSGPRGLQGQANFLRKRWLGAGPASQPQGSPQQVRVLSEGDQDRLTRGRRRHAHSTHSQDLSPCSSRELPGEVLRSKLSPQDIFLNNHDDHLVQRTAVSTSTHLRRASILAPDTWVRVHSSPSNGAHDPPLLFSSPSAPQGPPPRGPPPPCT